MRSRGEGDARGCSIAQEDFASAGWAGNLIFRIPTPALLATTAAIVLVAVWLPFSPLAPALGFAPLPHLYWPLVAATVLAYMALTQAVKVWLLRRHWL